MTNKFISHSYEPSKNEKRLIILGSDTFFIGYLLILLSIVSASAIFLFLNKFLFPLALPRSAALNARLYYFNMVFLFGTLVIIFLIFLLFYYISKRNIERRENEGKLAALKVLYQSILNEVSLVINPKNEQDLFHRMLRGIVKSGLITASWIGRLEKDNTIKYIAARGSGTQELMKIKIKADCTPSNMPLAARAVCLNKTVYNNDHLSDPGMAPWMDFLKKYRWASVCAIPVHKGGEKWGVFVCVSDKKGFFSEEILKFLSRINSLLVHSLNELDLKKQLEEEKEKVEFLVHHDYLTGLPNRSFLKDLLEGAIRRSGRNKTFLAVGMIDFDDFKYVNDAFGHEAGDVLLKDFSKRMLLVLRKSDHMVRLGGDEFVIILEDLKKAGDYYPFIRRLSETLKNPFIIKGMERILNISLGLTVFPVDGGSPDTILGRADKAMYNVKSIKDKRDKFWALYEE